MLTLTPELLARTEVRVSPQIIAHSALLELSAEELEEQIEEEAERNPAVELVRRRETVVAFGGSGALPGIGGEEERDLAAWLPAPTSARDDLLWQFRAVADRELVRVGETIISALDDHGYLRGDLEELAEVAGVPYELAHRALHLLQRLDPPGLGARDLAECLLLQCERYELEKREPAPPPALREFIAQCLQGGPRQMQRAAREGLGLSDPEVEEILDFIRTHFHPYPARLVEASARGARGSGLAYVADCAPPALPDVALEMRDGVLHITVPISERLQVRIDSLYQQIDAELRHRRRLQEHERTVRERVRAARELIRLLQRRQETLALVAEAIVQHQRAYFATGDPLQLVALDQKDIAKATGLHESTVCRAVKGKHVLMPDGALLPFEIFFDDALPAKVELHRLIAQEPPGRPYSDQELARLLSERGYQLARRTVTKYRLQLGLPSAHKRRRADQPVGRKRGRRIQEAPAIA